MTKNARRLRRQPTDVENLLWKNLRRQQLNGLSFRRQHTVGRYVLDFYCPSARLAIEVDGGQHGSNQGAARDQKRDAWLSGQGIRMIRFWNNDVVTNLRGVLETIVNQIDQMTTPSRREDRADLPLFGEGEKGKMP